MRVAMLAAMPMELKPIVRILNLTQSGDDYVGKLGDIDIVATKMGVGMTGATKTTERLLDQGDIDRVLVVGICGGLDETVPIGTVLHPEVLVDGANGTEYKSPAWAPITLSGRLATFDDIELELKMVPELLESGCTAVDMETAAVAAVCEKRGTPYAVFRAISDYATDGSVDAAVGKMVKADGSPDMGAALRYMITHPRRIPTLLRLGRGSAAAVKAAADAAIAALRA
jgi:nucleoside phosphorylase